MTQGTHTEAPPESLELHSLQILAARPVWFVGRRVDVCGITQELVSGRVHARAQVIFQDTGEPGEVPLRELSLSA